ncbi:MAG: serine hydrolase [Bacteroidales bacterium]|nr:serine hydrolase [Bacteroidales bacterium]
MKPYSRIFFLCCLSAICFSAAIVQPSYTPQTSWADSVLQTLSLDQKIAQLMMIRAHSDKDEAYCANLVQYVNDYQVGGVCFFQGGPCRQANLTNRLQAISKIPLLVSIDGEWGLGMRLDSIPSFPRQMALGAGNDTALIYQMGALMAKQCRQLGIHVNFAPCVDVNNNSQNPVINSRSFGGNPQLVARCGIAYAKGMQDNGVMACAKHFPGHGDTKIDSHKDAPIISHPLNRLEEIEFYPFAQLIKNHVDAIMVGHLLVKALDTASIATASSYITTSLLKDTMGFEGIVFTDGLEMGGIVKQYPQGELEVRCLIAGADVLLLPADFEMVSMAVKQAVLDGRLTMEDINKKCYKVLKMKEKYVIPHPLYVDNINTYKNINTPAIHTLNGQLMEKAITLLSNQNNIIPLSHKKQGLYLREAKSASTAMTEVFNKYLNINVIEAKENLMQKKEEIYKAKEDADYIIVSLSNLNQYPQKRYGMNEQTIRLLDSLTSGNIPVVLLLPGNPYAINELPFADKFAAIVIGYHPTDVAETALAEAVCGVKAITGHLPIELDQFAYNTGITTKNYKKNAHEKNHIFYKTKIDEIINNAIAEQAFPGCNVIIAQGKHILYNQCYGTYSYNDLRRVTASTVYDLASVTKVMATTLAVMKLYEENKINLNDKISKYLPYLKGSNKENIKIYQLLTHTAGLQAWIPFYKETLNKDYSFKEEWWQKNYSPEYAIHVADNLYLRTDFEDTLSLRISQCALKGNNNYLYSDLGFYLLAAIVKQISGLTLDVYVDQQFYKPMGLENTTFNPLKKIEENMIAPTENDTLFRKQLLCGYVHDQGAAMLGGVSGHAGLFSTAEDLLAICQMLLDKGLYKGHRYLKPQTVETFTNYYFPKESNCRRGLGFDKPARGKMASPCCSSASPLSYGHSGFTGTFIWIDPRYDLIYIFLSNRVNPSADNNKITQMSIRSLVHSFAYKMVE